MSQACPAPAVLHKAQSRTTPQTRSIILSFFPCRPVRSKVYCMLPESPHPSVGLSPDQAPVVDFPTYRGNVKSSDLVAQSGRRFRTHEMSSHLRHDEGRERASQLLRKACMGSILEARRAGKYPLSRARVTIDVAIVAKAAKSHGEVA
jgi:hypothetical protein